ncbi:MAG TPA: protein translocase subunit SecF [Candidatus Vogelbacteria bacterium]|nr:protein translocase subunit SecF [Candidatus Vogelbacteria bacterium]
MFIIKNRKIFFTLSGLLVLASLLAVIFWGLNLSIDFAGGTILEIEYQETRPTSDDLRLELSEVDLGNLLIQSSGDKGFILRFRDISVQEKEMIDELLSIDGQYSFTESRFSSIGPSIGRELARRGLVAIILVSLLIILFIAFVFRQVSQPISSWKYGLIAVLTLAHDIIIPVGIFSILGFFIGKEIDALFLTALLAILGLSVNDTIVIFDRIRENLRLRTKHDFEETVGLSLEQSFSRSINTSLTTLVVLLSLYFLGGATTRDFALVMSIGIVLGTYSSLFLAAPLLVAWEASSHRK